jgi:hypothetical protein
LPEAFHQTQAVQAIGKQQMIHVRHSISNPCLCDYGIFGESLPMIMGSCNANLHFVWSLARAAQPCSGNSLPYVVSHSGSLAPAFLTNGTAAVSLEAGTMWCSSLHSLEDAATLALMCLWLPEQSSSLSPHSLFLFTQNLHFTTMSSIPSSYRGRGGYAPRRGRGGWSQPFAKRQDSIKPNLQKHPLGDLISTVGRSDLRPSHLDLTPPLHIQGCEYVTSYNWLDSKDPTVVVPGE